MSELRYTANTQLEQLHARYTGTGHADTNKWEWATNQGRDTYAGLELEKGKDRADAVLALFFVYPVHLGRDYISPHLNFILSSLSPRIYNLASYFSSPSTALRRPRPFSILISFPSTYNPVSIASSHTRTVCSLHTLADRSIVGHPQLTAYLALADNETTARTRFEMIERMLQPCGPPPRPADDE